MGLSLEFEHIYKFQDSVLGNVNSLHTGFYLTGGTAVSRGYLNHRFSDDLDLFMNDDPRFVLWAERIIASLASTTKWSLAISLKEERFVRLVLAQGSMMLKVELVNDVPARVGTPVSHPTLGLLDTPENILANKVNALVDRSEPKDLADIWGLCALRGLTLADALVGAQGKAAGIFPADVARVLCSAQVADYDVIRWINPPSFKTYQTDLIRMGESLLML
jgi:hypothetical protein